MKSFHAFSVTACVALVTASLSSLTCHRGKDSIVATGDAAASARPTSSSAATTAAAVACVAEPKGGVTIPIKKGSEDVRIAAVGSNALVTWLARAIPPEVESEGARRSMGRVFDGSALGPETVLDSSDFADVVLSGALPIALGGALTAIACSNSWPSGVVDCALVSPGKKYSNLFKVNSLNFGFKGPGLAAVTSGSDSLVFLPHGGIRMLSTRAGGPKRMHTGPQNGKDVEAIVATLTTPDEAAVVYRKGGVVYGRRVGWDEKWRGPEIALSEAGSLAGAPAIANGPTAGSVVAWFATRKNEKEPWHVVVADWRADKVERSRLAAGAEPTQGPALAATNDPKCMLVSWVEGAGDRTVTHLARSCEGRIDRANATRLSREGVEGGRAALATSETTAFAVWREYPKGSPSELRVARLTCK